MSSDRAYVEGLVPVVAVQDITRPGSPGPDRDFRDDDPDGYCVMVTDALEMEPPAVRESR